MLVHPLDGLILLRFIAICSRHHSLDSCLPTSSWSSENSAVEGRCKDFDREDHKQETRDISLCPV